MGRPGYGYGAQPSTPFELRKIRLNQGGYDDGGAYWGTGQPLYWYCAYEVDDTGILPLGDDVEISDYIRADSREHAKEIIRRKYPQATFKR